MQYFRRNIWRVIGLISSVAIIIGGSFWGAKQITESLRRASQPTAITNQKKIITLLDDPSYAATLKKLREVNAAEKYTIDTDGDGIPDATEINTGTNPLVAGTAGDNKPLLGKQVTNLSSFTNNYLSQLPEDLPKDQIYAKERLTAFVNTAKGPLLPDVPLTDIKRSSATGKNAVIEYLGAISATQNKQLQTVTNEDIEAATQQHFQGESQPLNDIITKLTRNIEVLQSIPAPAETIELHRKLIAANQSLLNNVKLLPLLTTDMVGGLIGSQNIADLAPVFQDLTDQIKKLDAKYNH